MNASLYSPGESLLSASSTDPRTSALDQIQAPGIASSTQPAVLQERRPLRPKRPPRASQACESCRSRKTKCDQKQPCYNCKYHALECYYRKGGSDAGSTTNKRRGTPGSEGSSTKQHQKVRQEKRPASPLDEPTRTPPTSYTPPADNISKATQATPVSNVSAPSGYDTTAIGLESVGLAPIHIVRQTLADEVVNRDEETTSLGGTNTYTNGTEFYGGSSNLAILDSLFSWARKRANTISNNDPEATSKEAKETDQLQDAGVGPRHLSNSHLSIVDLMYNAERPNSASESITPADRRRGLQNNRSFPQHNEIGGPGLDDAQLDVLPTRNVPRYNSVSTSGSTSIAGDSAADSMARQSIIAHARQRDVEKIFVDSYFSNKHYIHPLLCENAFRARCAREVWHGPSYIRPPDRQQRKRSRFLSLYYSVVALGAINAGIEDNSPLTSYYRNLAYHADHAAWKKPNTLEWANRYFDLAKQALGDVFEGASLETCQALFLMTVFSQNALKPHACFMYSGMAVRTAVAIGLSNENSHDSLTRRKEARRTWWCIYSHEVEMCCSSGRLDSLKDPRHYSNPLPKYTKEPGCDPTELEDRSVAMIPVMVELSQILKTASQDIYHDSAGRSMQEKSQIAFQLEKLLTAWKDKLPSFLNIDTASLNDTEWAFKQKLVLRMRLYNARILIHRPFLVASSTSYSSSEFSQHVEICLDASRKTIQMIYDSFVHRIYLRTWWYCTTYTLYASMIVLHLVLLEFPKVAKEELIRDVEKSLEIFSAMKFVVARRCAELTREILSVAKRYLRYTQQRTQTAAASGGSGSSALSDIYGESMPPSTGSETWDDSFLMALLNQEGPGPVRAHALANLLDPIVLEDFAVGSSDFAQTVTSSADTVMDQTEFGSGPEGQEAASGRAMAPPYGEGDGVLGYQFSQLEMDLFRGAPDWSQGPH